EAIMNLIKFCKIMLFITILSLVYIHLQMKIIDLAYTGRSKEIKINSLLEENSFVKYKILALKSASSLGVQMLAEQSHLQFASPEDIVQIELEQTEINETALDQTPEEERFPLLSLLSFGKRAEAHSR
ncbi:MAG: hypothetical protein KC713_05315, partial [Candidatus Omnitrophica bacterium]|nr:hypothetical protein [Candidatus Omnitrophota bacterium]